MKTAEELLNDFVGTDEEATTFINDYSVLGRVNKNELAKHNATFAVQFILDDTLALTNDEIVLGLEGIGFANDAAQEVAIQIKSTANVFQQYINGQLDEPLIGDPELQQLLDVLVNVPDSICAYSQKMRKHIEELSKDYLFDDVTLEQVKAIRSPGTWKSVAIGSGNSHVVLAESTALLSNTNRGGFRFTINPNESFSGSIGIRIKAKTVDSTEFAYIEQFTQTIERDFEQGVLHAHVLSRSAALSGYRHFIFEYLEPYKDALTSVSVEALV